MQSKHDIYLISEGLGYPNSSAVDTAKKIEGARVQLMGSMESCQTCVVNKSKQLSHPKKTKHTVTQPLGLVYTSIVGPIYPRSLYFRYIHKFSDLHTKHLAIY